MEKVLKWRKVEIAGMINCMRFKPKAGQAEDLFKAYAEYVRDYLFDDIMHKIIDLGDGESFHSFSGPVVNCDDYL